ncbi:hypothetical protein AB990_19575 [Alkalihalobacillus pseudalcaliphilus]|nr:hypothetical protein AB990_19575 [Alkalihalobacillus pseudalcaliphilus]
MSHFLICAGALFLFFVFSLNESVVANASEKYEVISQTLNLRSEPSGTSDIVGQLKKGDQLVSFNEQFGWIQTYYQGEVAWVASYYLAPVQGSLDLNDNTHKDVVTIQRENSIIRSAPSINSQVIGSANIGNEFQVLHKENDWLQIRVNDAETGWIASWLTEKPASQEPNRTQTGHSNNLNGYTIVIDPGHGGRDPGAIGFKHIFEKTIVLQTANKVVAELEQRGAHVVATRNSDVTVTLDERVAIANKQQSDAVISIHYDSSLEPAANGFTTYYYSTPSLPLAESIHASNRSGLPLHDRGIKQVPFKVIRESMAPAILLELGFVSNQHDAQIIVTEQYQDQVAKSIADGIADYIN